MSLFGKKFDSEDEILDFVCFDTSISSVPLK